MKRNRKIKDPRKKQGDINQTRQNGGQCVPNDGDKEYAVPKASIMKAHYAKKEHSCKTWLDYLNDEDENLAIGDVKTKRFGVTFEDHLTEGQYIFDDTLLRETYRKRRYADLGIPVGIPNTDNYERRCNTLDADSGHYNDGHSFDGIHKPLNRELENARVAPSHPHKCHGTTNRFYSEALNHSDTVGENCTISFSDVPNGQEFQVCRSCSFLTKVEEKLKETESFFADIRKDLIEQEIRNHTEQ